MTKTQKKRMLREAIQQYMDAVIDDVWLGTYEPDSWAGIKRNLKTAKVQLDKAIRKVLK